MLKESKEANHKLKVTVSHDKVIVDDVLCEVHLPIRVTDPIELCLKPDKEQAVQINNLFEFSIKGEIKNSRDDVEFRISANEVYTNKQSSIHWGPDISEHVKRGHPFDLTITTFFNDREKEDKVHGTFWLTPSIMLRNKSALEYQLSGEIKVKKYPNFKFTLFNGLTIEFDHHYRYLKKDNGDTVSFAELVANFDISSSEDDISSFLEYLDDFLMLMSFSARQRCVCLGWQIFDGNKEINFYRRDVTIPKLDNKHDSNDVIVDLMHFDKFIDIAYRKFVEINSKDLIRQAIFRSYSKDDDTIESKYLTLYSALETLVLFYSRNNEMEFIIPEENWTVFRKDLEKYIKFHPQFSEQKEKRKLVYDKLKELNRTPFLTAFNAFCKKYDIDLSDLWPVIDRKDGVSLSDIRHKLIHGDSFNLRELDALMYASIHLRWTVERSILSILGWPIEDSKVSEGFLHRNMYPHKDWIEHRKILTDF